jgi:arylsulfatase A-like enzyme
MIRRRALLPLAGLPLAGFSRAFSQPRRQPNVIVILADDQGWGDLSLHGNTNLRTPNLDQIGTQGVRFEHFYVCAVCAPTRAEFLTGRYHPRGGVRGVSTGAERLNTAETTLAQSFRAAGYRTAAFGKWHNGTQYPYHPTARGFEEFYGFTEGHWGQYFDTEMDRNGRLTRGKGYLADDITTEALQWMRARRNQPFFLYLPYNIPHTPPQVPDSYFRRYASFQPKMTARDPRQEDLPLTRAALAMVENLDANVGRVLQRLQDLRLAQDTIVVYFSDNGPNSWRWNGGMKGRKGSLDEGGLRSPLFIRWPGQLTAGTRIPQIAGAIDLLPTLCSLTGVTHRGTQPLDGRDLSPLMRNQPDPQPDRLLFSMQNRRTTVRSQRFRLDPAGALFDLDQDPGQERDAARDHPREHARLSAALQSWTQEMLALNGGPDTRPYPVGEGPFPTLLPARDGVPHGGIQRSAQAPNCSYFKNWTSTQDSMTWDIEIARGGSFDVILHYACPANATGSTVECEWNGVRLTGKIAEPHDPPALGAAQDRTSRAGESYFKFFRRLPLGSMTLPSGRGLFTLRATEIPGPQVGEIRYLEMVRLG